MIKIKHIQTKELNLLEKIYIVEIIKGLFIIFKHLFRNLFKPSNIPTISYPEEKIELLGMAKFRSKHRIKLRKDNTPKCVACMLCATVCPSKCITIEAKEVEGNIEKEPEIFNIDYSRCIMCGLCVEACPEDAITMDTEEILGGAYDRNLNLKKDGLFATKKELFLNLKHTPISTKGATNRLINENSEK